MPVRSDSEWAPLPGAEGSSWADIEERAFRDLSGLPTDIATHLIRTYGARYNEVLKYRQDGPAWSERVIPGEPVIRAQFHLAVDQEMAVTVDDILQRRTEISQRGLASPRAKAMAAEALRQSLPSGQQAHPGR